jgi:thiamine biosynthesis lipoprotein
VKTDSALPDVDALDAEERRFPIMGSHGHVIVVGGAPDLAGDLADRAVGRLEQLEARWSRFRPDSELSQLTRADGDPRLVSADTVVLVDALRRGWELTAGRFDPTVLDAMIDLGYSASWPDVASPIWLPQPHATPGCAGLDLHPGRGLVRLPRGVHLDPGGLGKGLAADLVATEAMTAGARGVMVNVGGDLRVIGRPPGGAPSWVIGIDHPEPGLGHLARVDLADGGIATSTSVRRRWRSAEGARLHHLVEPRTGRPSEPGRQQVTAVSATSWWAEVLAIVAFLDGELDDDSAAALIVEGDGSTRTLGDPRWFAMDQETDR